MRVAEFIILPNNEILLNDTELNNTSKCVIQVSLENADNLMKLGLLVDTIKSQYPRIEIDVVISYLCYAQSDRRTTEKSGSGLKVFANFLNSLLVDKYFVIDPHSYATEQAIKNCFPVRATSFQITQSIWKTIGEDENFLINCILTPDDGAYTRYKSIKSCDTLVVEASKVRDKNGNIVSSRVNSQELDGKNVLIFDDLCMGGGTFKGLIADINKSEYKPKSISLYVTHGVFCFKDEKAMHELSDSLLYIFHAKTRQPIFQNLAPNFIGLDIYKDKFNSTFTI